ncbi:Methyltransferase, cyclopropane fatty acid synthase OS=Microvirga lotononidis GN=MicloDRAFT_00025440 PE=4 SV=1: Methyltransf_23 [Gemmataceae bacterium]|nr:Methyltransferase, cyclopropane fatty acid synthase OS=Microvirga lotononidis GN=MicloDRAFT_00025440 PE=4 SV=1: Methyltransf_23 [Gemmataceae bacterium]VTU00528.1 Methyltransferase, cyclopropane fatty acid synthase OS=Microvirga lotononidis GN=MicloDRAFT_00025440 PE=4 SV=1: Methyltransf_23 [Gemmataceae bacterium]
MITPHRPLAPGVVADHYQELDRLYREVWGEHVHHGLWRTGRESPLEAVEQLTAFVAEQAGVTRGDRVCDIGSGYGASARLVARTFDAQVTALTIVPAQQAFAEATNPGGTNPRYLLRDWLDNGLPAESFDAAYAIESTEHMLDKARAFVEAFRVLRPGGRFAICAWIAAEKARPWEKRNLLEPICREGRLPGMGTETDYRELLTAAGFEVEAATDVTREVRGTWGICLRRAAGRFFTDAAGRAFLLSAASRNRIFLVTMARIWLAYRTGAMRYLVFRARRPGVTASARG